MYIEFELPKGRLGSAVLDAIKASIILWATRYSIPSQDYTQKTIKYTHRLGFNRREHFSLFGMTYTDFDFRIKTVQNEKIDNC